MVIVQWRIVNRQLGIGCQQLVAHRHIGRLSFTPGQGDADQLGLLRIGAGGLGVEGDQRRGAQGLQQACQGRLAVDDGIRRRFVNRALGFDAGRFLGKQGELAARRGARAGRETVDQGAKLQLTEQLDHLRLVVVLHTAGVQVQRHPGHIGDDGHQVLAEEGAVAAGLQRLARALGCDLIQVGVDCLHAAVGLDQVGGALLAHTLDARHIVRGIAQQRLQVDELARRQAPALLHRFRRVDDGVAELAAAGQHADTVADHLHDVPVPGDDGGVDALGFGLASQRAQHVVGLVAIARENGDVQRLDDLLDARHLLAQLVGHALAGALVVGELLVAEGFTYVECHSDVIRLLLAQGGEQHGKKAEGRVGQLAAARGHGSRQGVISAESQRVAVNQEEFCHELDLCSRDA